ncbi:MAG: hypothetical protein GPJ54_15045 [Candidatus Heimdallarchaeota archaeon]|nr:hypothetical protein [Candidatus Heimdallarchaeota archaeon]
MYRQSPIAEYVSLFFVVIAVYFNFVAIQTSLDGLSGFDDVVVVMMLFFQFGIFLLSLPFFLRAFKHPLISNYEKLMVIGYLLNSLIVFTIVFLLEPNAIGYVVFVMMGLIQILPVIKILKK